MSAFSKRWPLTTEHTLQVQEVRKTLEARVRLVVEPAPIKPPKTAKSGGRRMTKRQRKARQA